MEEDKSAIELLKEFARKTDRKIDCSKKYYPTSTINPCFLSQSYAIIPNQKTPTNFFISYCDLKGFGDNAFYSGIFFEIPAPHSTLIRIREKDILDKLNPFLKQSSYKSRIRDFDKQVVITENDFNWTNKLFHNTHIQNAILEIFKLDKRIRIGVNAIELMHEPTLKGKSNFGIYITEEWLLDDTLIENLFMLSEKIRTELF